MPDFYREAKERHPGMLLMFRMGEVYKLFAADAVVAAGVLGVPERRYGDVIEVQVPLDQLERCLYAILRAGHRLAVYEQA